MAVSQEQPELLTRSKHVRSWARCCDGKIFSSIPRSNKIPSLQDSVDQSPLQRTPAELRLDIYQLALKEDIKLEPRAWAPTELQSDETHGSRTAQLAVAMMQAAEYLRDPRRLPESEKRTGLELACQQVRDECQRLRPSTVTVKVFHCAWAADLARWATEIFGDLLKLSLDRRLNFGLVTIDLG